MSDDDKPWKALVVDDDEFALDVCSRQLSKLSYEALCFNNGEAACTSFDNSFKIVFIDLIMPDMDGFEVARRMQTLQAELGFTVPMVGMTGDQELIVQHDEGLSAGLCAIVGKPLTTSSVKSALDSIGLSYCEIEPVEKKGKKKRKSSKKRVELKEESTKIEEEDV